MRVDIEVNCTTGETTERPLTAEEIAQREVDAAAAEADRLAAETEAQRILDLKSSAHAKLVAGEPMTEEEAAVLIN
jgi:hypothetical protein